MAVVVLGRCLSEAEILTIRWVFSRASPRKEACSAACHGVLLCRSHVLWPILQKGLETLDVHRIIQKLPPIAKKRHV